MGNLDDLYRKILSKGPSPGTIFIVLSEMKQVGQLKKVIQECLKALSMYPDDIPIRQLLAETFFETGLLLQAEMELRKVTERINGLISAYKLQAEIYASQGRMEEAAEVLKVYLAHRPEDQFALAFLEKLKPQEEMKISESVPAVEEEAAPAEAVAEETPAIAGEEVPEIATPKLAEIYFDQGLLQEAIETYQKVIEKNPEDERCRARLEELKAMMAEEKLLKRDTVREKKEKMIAILEGWLANIREKSKRPKVPSSFSEFTTIY